MNLENSLIGAYTIGTQEEIENYVEQGQSNRDSFLIYGHTAESIVMGSTFFLLPDNIDQFVYFPLLADLGTRWISGVINTTKNYISARKSNNPGNILDVPDGSSHIEILLHALALVQRLLIELNCVFFFLLLIHRHKL